MTSLSASATERLPYRDPALPLDKRIDDLVERLTLDERIAMLHQYAPAVPRLGLGAFRTGTEALHGVAWLGEATLFPQAVGLGATWDEELVRAVAEAVAVEQRAFHHHRRAAVGAGPISLQAWAPVVNLLRDPRWGRNEEGYSEDPVHTARLATAYCRGLAGDDPQYMRTAPVLKHFLAYNNEDDRCTTSSSLRPRVLHEYDLAAFRPVIADGAATGVMAAYNLVNGRPCHVSPLINELRRWSDEELFVVSDAEAPSNLVDPEHYFDDHAESHAAALKAGIDSFTDHGEDSGVPIGRLREALRRGMIDESDVDRAVRRQLLVRFRLGEFDPDLDPYAGIGPEVIDCAEHRDLARRSATESVVLLRNDGMLPLAAPRVAVIGPLGDMLCEDWYSGTPPYRITCVDGLRAALDDVVFVEGADRVALRSHTSGALLGTFDITDWGGAALTLRDAETGRYLSLKSDDTLVADQTLIKSWEVRETFRLEADGDAVLLQSVLTGRFAAADGTVTAETREDAERWHRELVRDGTAAARAAAEAADVAIVVLGNHPLINGRETQDRASIALPAGQEALLRAVAEVRPNTALVVMSSYPFALDWAHEHLPAVVWMSHGGQESGRALADVLLGEAEPGGRLPQTWYRGDDELPDPLDYDVIKAGWTYQYHRATPLYPFGHGLSYTTFDYRDLRLSSASVDQNGSVDVSVTLANTGPRAGSEIVQLHVRALDARYQAPRVRLADFGKVRLDPGQSQELTFHLPAEALAHWDVATGAFTVDPGAYEVVVARSADDVMLSAPLTVIGPAPSPRRVVDRRTSSVDFDDYADITIVDATRETGDAVAATGAGTLWFHSVDLSGAVRIEAEVSREGDGSAPACLEFRTGDRLLAELSVPMTGGRYTWSTVAADFPAPLAGVHDLRLTLYGDFRLAAFQFRSAR
ncbi:glycoside hydrolase family 3 protein [Kutzneria buriramensis]|uniref:Exo-alpha-(1->6)-L-arabinopyranosidase n=1 Tax=Kutzneria buriramensis TaxID=1045776 RepID=A0A3E0GTQ7_9PSEU|nr:glycoside hydrolase family 3 protein [Kutzneria buriramensis]REH26393.1 beta-glucosidase [Kutzneria buriramensis]